MTTRQERAQERFRDRLDNGSIESSGQGVSGPLRTPETAREVLQSDEFFLHLGRDISRAGLVAERGNGIATWLVGTSRIFNNPLNEIIKGSSSAGKNHLARTVLKFFPAEEVVRASSLSQRSMNYVGRDALAHKIFYVDEIGSVRTSQADPVRFFEGGPLAAGEQGYRDREFRYKGRPIGFDTCFLEINGKVVAWDKPRKWKREYWNQLPDRSGRIS